MKILLSLTDKALADDPQAVDLGALGMGSFNPYIFERESLWILLPLISLLLVFLHLKHYSPLGRGTPWSPEKQKTPENLL